MCLICGEEEAVRLCGLHRILNNEEACLLSYSDGDACLSDDLTVKLGRCKWLLGWRRLKLGRGRLQSVCKFSYHLQTVNESLRLLSMCFHCGTTQAQYMLLPYRNTCYLVDCENNTVGNRPLIIGTTSIFGGFLMRTNTSFLSQLNKVVNRSLNVNSVKLLIGEVQINPPFSHQ